MPKGLTTGEISAHFAEIYGASVSKETISRITDKVLEELTDWAARPLESTYAAIFIDAIVVKVRDGQVANRPFCAAIGVTLAGERDILGLWAGTGGEGAKFWMAVLTDLRNRGVNDSFFVVCDGLKGLPEVVSNVWPAAIVQSPRGTDRSSPKSRSVRSPQNPQWRETAQPQRRHRQAPRRLAHPLKRNPALKHLSLRVSRARQLMWLAFG